MIPLQPGEHRAVGREAGRGQEVRAARQHARLGRAVEVDIDDRRLGLALGAVVLADRDEPATDDFGRKCLLARRMVQRGVRFVQVHSGDPAGWDAHNDVTKNHSEYCGKTDKPIAGLLTDLKRNGLLDDTLVVWCGEFGRMPMSEQGKGRDHNPWRYCGWIAGAGITGGRSYGETDAIGLRAAVDPVHVNQFHATLLHLMGLDHRRLTFEHHGLEERLTGPAEIEIVKELLS